MGKSDIAPEKNVATKSRPMVQTMSGVENTKRSPVRSAATGDSCGVFPLATRPEARMVATAASTKRNERALSA